MENRFDIDDFERSLKEQADQFLLVPSERVWRSLYNDLHPGSRWPSLGMGLVILISLFWIGHSNQNQTLTEKEIQPSGKPIKTTNASTNTSANPTTGTTANTEKTLSLPGISSGNDIKNPLPPASVNYSAGLVVANTIAVSANRKKAGQLNNGTKDGVAQAGASADGKEVAGLVAENSLKAKEKSGSTNIAMADHDESGADWIGKILAKDQERILLMQKQNKVAEKSVNPLQNTAINQKADDQVYGAYTTALKKDRKPVELVADIVSGQLPAIAVNSDVESASEGTIATTTNATLSTRKKNSKMRWEYFVEPVFSNAYFGGRNLNKTGFGLLTNSVTGREMSTKALLGFVTGVDAMYKLGTNLSIGSGFHFGYTGVNVRADFVHPTIASVTYRNRKGEVYNKNYMTYYGNKGEAGQDNLRNYNFQLAIPVGLDWEFYDGGNIKVGLISAIEPFVIIGEKNYLLSGDGKNFIEDPNQLRTFNLNGNLGTMVTFQNNRVSWRIGPTVRYQILSTYNNTYPVKEHLINYGLRLGVSKNH